MDELMRSRWIGPLGVVLLIAVVAFVLALRPGTPGAGGSTATTTETYQNSVYGISFAYPDSYELTEADIGNGERAAHRVTLIQKADLPAPQNGEGPTAIEFAFYQNNLDNLTALEWARNDSRSNWKQGDGSYATTTVDRTEGIFYRWSGLYEGATFAFPHAGNIVAASVTYLSPTDQIIADYEQMLSTLVLTGGDTSARETVPR